MKRKKYYCSQKRTTFLKLFLKALSLSLICTLIFASLFRSFLTIKVRNDIQESLSDNARKITTGIAKNQTKESFYSDLSLNMSFYTNYDIAFDGLPNPMYDDQKLYEISSSFGNSDIYAMSAIVDKNEKIISSSRANLITLIQFDKEDTDNGWYICDTYQLDLPEVQKLYDVYFELCGTDEADSYHDATMNIESAYVDKTTRTFVPHEADMKIETYYKSNGSEQNDVPDKVDTKHISITLNDDNFELITFNKNEESHPTYPRNALCILIGTPPECFDKNSDKICRYSEDGVTGLGGWQGDMSDFNCSMSTPVYINGEVCTLNLYYNFNANGTIIEKYYRLGIIAFGTVTILLALLWAWQKNVRNKARYAFEDYQRDLTDHLAHDIKTPLMAISGYAENVLNGKLSDTEQKEYLTSILDNVSFTDSLISKTLYLNHMDGKRTAKEAVNLNDMAEEIISKYSLLLKEKKIVYSVSGNSEVNVNKTAMETIIENLISNAVKYTPNESTIRIVTDKKHIDVINSVSEKIDTNELTQPFVRGDKARTNVEGNGLGLAIVERTALVNNFKLLISCTDTEFKATIKL